MERFEAETVLLEKLNEIRELYLEYNPDGKYLSVCITDDGVQCNNAHWGDDAGMIIDCARQFESEKCPAYIMRNGKTEFQ